MPLTIIAFLAIFGIVVFVHELGHFVVAKLAGVRVDEFGFGYPPRLFRLFKRGDTVYTVNAIPIGGFVKVAGDDKPDDARSMARRSPWVRAAFLLAGPAMNLGLAALLFAVTFMLGVPAPGVGILEVEVDSPAARAGLQVGDVIVGVDGRRVVMPSDLQALIEERLGREVALTVRRGGQELSEPLRLVPRAQHRPDQGAMGVRIGMPEERVSYPLFSALGLGLQQALFTVVAIIGGLVAMMRGAVPADLAGPIGIAQMTGQVARSGLPQLVEWTAFLSVNLFIINLLPIPALDGGRLVFVGLELLRGGRCVDPQKEGVVHFVGIVLLLALFLVISYFDVQRLARGVSILGP
ncbi:MAG: M50 family metallopeptidase [Anaerolineae bacterium]